MQYYTTVQVSGQYRSRNENYDDKSSLIDGLEERKNDDNEVEASLGELFLFVQEL